MIAGFCKEYISIFDVSKILEKMTDDSRTCQKIAKFDS